MIQPQSGEPSQLAAPSRDPTAVALGGQDHLSSSMVTLMKSLPKKLVSKCSALSALWFLLWWHSSCLSRLMAWSPAGQQCSISKGSSEGA